MMLLIVLMLCTCATISAQDINWGPVINFIPASVRFTSYATTDCTGTVQSTEGYVYDKCIDFTASYGTSDKYTCSNNVPYDNEYNGNPICSGSPKVIPLTTSCTRYYIIICISLNNDNIINLVMVLVVLLSFHVQLEPYSYLQTQVTLISLQYYIITHILRMSAS
jgi:hypothetical protein